MGDEHVHRLALDIHLFLRDEPTDASQSGSYRGELYRVAGGFEEAAIAGRAPYGISPDRDWKERDREVHERWVYLLQP
jgi:hypothetical protein